MHKSLTIKAVSIMMILILFGGCVTSTKMKVYVTEADGKPINDATVLVNGENIGQTPNARAKVSNFVGSNTQITVIKDGYNTVRTEAIKDAKPANIVLGILIPLNFFAFLWCAGPRAQQEVILSPAISGE